MMKWVLFAGWLGAGGFMRLAPRMLLGLLLCMLFVSVGSADESQPSADDTERVVRLIVNYGDGVEKHMTQLSWREGATVFDVLQAAARHPRGVRFVHQGKGATVLVTRIDDVANEGGRGGGRNWIYRVNDRMGERSAGICPVQAGDTILWSFESYR